MLPKAVMSSTAAAVDFAQPVNQLDAFHFRHHEIGDRQVKAGRSMFLDRRFAVMRGFDLIAVLAQQVEEQLAHRPVVVDDQNARRFVVGCGIIVSLSDRLHLRKDFMPLRRQRNGKSSKSAALAFHPDLPAVILDNAVTDG